jgi:hypothetical protein
MKKTQGNGKALDAHFWAVAVSDKECQPNGESQAEGQSGGEARPLFEFQPPPHLPLACGAEKPDIESQYRKDEN